MAGLVSLVVMSVVNLLLSAGNFIDGNTFFLMQMLILIWQQLIDLNLKK